MTTHPHPRRPPSKRARRQVALLGAMVVTTVGLAAALWSGTPTVQLHGGWFWPLHLSKLFMNDALALAAFSVLAFGGAVRLARATPSARSRRLVLAALLALGFVYHHVLALAAGRGMNEMRDRIIHTGHAEFAATAAGDVKVWSMLTGYENFVKAPEQRYARSKPPGQLLFYCAAAAVADRLMPVLFDPAPPAHAPGIASRRHYRLVNFATIFFPLIALLVLFPLTYLSRHFLGSLRATWPALLYLLAPAPALIQLHLDQALYPVLVTSYWACIATAATRSQRSLPWWALSGVLAWVCLFVSFSLLPALLIGVGVAVALTAEASLRQRWRSVLKGQLVSGAALLLASVVAAVAINYRPLRAYLRAMEHHARWKRWDESFRWPAAQLNIIEAAYWLGPPLVTLFLYQVFYARVGWRQVFRVPPTVLALTTVVAIACSALLGRTLGEVARLWMFFTPVLVLAAAGALMRLRVVSPALRLALIAALQVLWTISLKAFQDFY